MRCRIEVLSDSAPSAVCTTLVPSWVLRTAWVSPPICERRPSEIARPAASSAARLIRSADESRSSDLLIALFVVDRLRYAFIAAMLVLTLRPMMFLLGMGLSGSRCIRAAGCDSCGYGSTGRGLDPNPETFCDCPPRGCTSRRPGGRGGARKGVGGLPRAPARRARG